MVNSISVLGSTGSVGRQTLEAAAGLKIPVKAISGNSNTALLEEQARRFKPELVAVFDEAGAKKLKIALADTNIKIASGISGLCECAAAFGDCVVTAVSGSVGIIPTLAAIEEGKRIALANKETLVCGGEIVMARAKEKGAEIIPVDSEHSAIFQCLEAQGNKSALREIILTCSGGPFRGLSPEEMINITPAQAVSHPNWSMGPKISVDSATLMNKGLEFIEAMHLFGVSPEKIRVIIHPESIIHSMVEFHDGSVMAQLGVPDMGLPIRFALTYPSREKWALPAPNFAGLGALTFSEPNLTAFPCLSLAIECAKRGGIAPAVMSAANEEAVSQFLNGGILFTDIYNMVDNTVSALGKSGAETLEDIIALDAEARRFVREKVKSA